MKGSEGRQASKLILVHRVRCVTVLLHTRAAFLYQGGLDLGTDVQSVPYNKVGVSL